MSLQGSRKFSPLPHSLHPASVLSKLLPRALSPPSAPSLRKPLTVPSRTQFAQRQIKFSAFPQHIVPKIHLASPRGPVPPVRQPCPGPSSLTPPQAQQLPALQPHPFLLPLQTWHFQGRPSLQREPDLCSCSPCSRIWPRLCVFNYTSLLRVYWPVY